MIVYFIIIKKNYQEGELIQTENKKVNDCYRNILDCLNVKSN